MSIGRLPGGLPPPLPANQIDEDPSALPGAKNAADAAGNKPANSASSSDLARHVHHAHYQGTLFRQDARFAKLQRVAAPRTPSRGAVGKRGTGRAKSAAGGMVEEDDVEQSHEVHVPDEMQSLQVRIQSQSEQDGSQDESSQGRREEKRFDRIVQRRAALEVDVVQEAADRQPGNAATVRRAQLASLPPLPLMHSLEDVVQVIQAATRADPAGGTIALLLRRINAAVMRNEIQLPRVTRVSEARAALISAFGTGHDGQAPLSEALRSAHAMLPLWLINLSKRRTAIEQAQAAARLTLVMSAPAAPSAQRAD